MTTTETPIQKGQVWRRKKDGKLVEVYRYEKHFGDVKWEPVGGGRTQACYEDYFRRNYELSTITDQDISEIPEVREMCNIIYRQLEKDTSYTDTHDAFVELYDPRPLAVKLYRLGWRKR